MLRSRFLWQIYAALGAVLMVSIVAFSTLTLAQLREDTLNNAREALGHQAAIFKHYLRPRLSADRLLTSAELKRITNVGNSRITLINTMGAVLADNRQDPTLMDNHADRPEVIAAQINGIGYSERFSNTIKQNMLYVAVTVHDEESQHLGFLRIAVPLSDIEAQQAAIRNRLMFSASIVTAVFLAIGFVLARRLSRPIAEVTAGALKISEGDYDFRLPESSADEVGELSRTLNGLARGTQQRIQAALSNRNQLAAILGGLTEGVIAVGLDNQILHINESAIRMLRLDGDGILDAPMQEVLANNEINRAVDTCISQHRAVHSTIQVNDRTLDVLVVVLQNEDASAAAGAIIVLQDVTEMLRLEQVRSDFVANASHELKTPIAAIRGFAETILDDEDMAEEVRLRFVGRIRSQAARLDNIVQDLIHLSRFDAYAVKMQKGKIDLGSLLAHVYQEKLEDAADADIDFKLELAAETVEVQGELTALEQMVTNLVDNAFKYSGSDGAVVLRLGCVGPMAMIEVEDNGIGIAEDEQQRIFERFYRVDRGRSREQGGTGLGLAIVKHIALSHNGSVSVASELEKGTTFCVNIPLVNAAQGQTSTI